jgi:hypothetical protein
MKQVGVVWHYKRILRINGNAHGEELVGEVAIAVHRHHVESKSSRILWWGGEEWQRRGTAVE